MHGRKERAAPPFGFRYGGRERMGHRSAARERIKRQALQVLRFQALPYSVHSLPFLPRATYESLFIFSLPKRNAATRRNNVVKQWPSGGTRHNLLRGKFGLSHCFTFDVRCFLRPPEVRQQLFFRNLSR